MHFDGSIWHLPSEAFAAYDPEILKHNFKAYPMTCAALAGFADEHIGKAEFDAPELRINPRPWTEAYHPRFGDHGFYDFALPHDGGTDSLLLLCTYSFYRAYPSAAQPAEERLEVQGLLETEAQWFCRRNERFADMLYNDFHARWRQLPLISERECRLSYEETRAPLLRKMLKILPSAPVLRKEA